MSDLSATAQVRRSYLDAAGVAATLLQDPAVATAWDQDSALAKLTVGALAGHLARQVVRAQQVVASNPPAEEPISLLDHYARSAWVQSDLDDEPNVVIRHASEQDAAGGPAAVVARVETARRALAAALPEEPTDRVAHLPWVSWSLSLDDFLVTRLVEIAVHCDDLAVSVGLATPPLPAAVLEPVFAVLCRLAADRHGPTAVLRALSRAERAPATVSAF